MEKEERLTSEERALAAEIGVYLVNAHGTDIHGWPGSYLKTVTVCLTREDAWQEMERLPLEPGWDEFRVSGPTNLLELFEYGDITADRVREFLRKIDAGEQHKKLPSPLTQEERERAAKIQVYYIWYEDRFGYGGDRDSFPVAVCLSREEAEREFQRRVREGSSHSLTTGYDGIEIVGPCNIANEYRPGVVREVLRKIEAGESAPVFISSIEDDFVSVQTSSDRQPEESLVQKLRKLYKALMNQG